MCFLGFAVPGCADGDEDLAGAVLVRSGEEVVVGVEAGWWDEPHLVAPVERFGLFAVATGGGGCGNDAWCRSAVADAQVLPIFEGVKPILTLKVVGRSILAR